jgi:site-specific DNA recombinase
MTKKTAALYLRSSKDRSDISPAAQRRMLQELALSRGITVVAEFSDAVESGKDEHRPGFQRLLQAIRNPKRGWATLLVLDTARIARRRHIAVIFEEVECRKRGIDVVYRSLPDADPITNMLLKSILQAMDEWHSLTSRDKGLAGMAENVRTGFRAGGRAPTGYRLAHHATGAIRDGEAVTKSKLEPDPVMAGPVAQFLAARANGVSRTAAARQAGLKLTGPTLVGMEWNALTYAGHTVWNVHAERKDGGYVGGQKRRPRSEWVIQRDTHPGLISQQQADAILATLEAFSPHRVRNRGAAYLLTGLLQSPDGTRWTGDRGSYRWQAPGQEMRYIKAQELEEAVVERVMADLQGPAFIRALTQAARAAASEDIEDPTTGLRATIADTNKQIDRLVELSAQSAAPAPFLRKVAELEGQRQALATELQRREEEYRQSLLFHQVAEHEVRALLVSLANDMAEADREGLKHALFTMLDRVELDPGTLACTVHYRLSAEHLIGDDSGLRSKPRGDASLNRTPTMGVTVDWKKVG